MRLFSLTHAHPLFQLFGCGLIRTSHPSGSRASLLACPLTVAPEHHRFPTASKWYRGVVRFYSSPIPEWFAAGAHQCTAVQGRVRWGLFRLLVSPTPIPGCPTRSKQNHANNRAESNDEGQIDLILISSSCPYGPLARANRANSFRADIS